MATIQEIESGIEAANKIIDNPSSSEAVKNVAKKKLAQFVKQREALGNAASVSETTKEVVSAGGDVVSAILATLKQYMESNAGGGLDSESVRAMISEYLKTQKVSLEDLDKSVLDEIKKNQTVVLNLPNFGLKFEVSSAIGDIPNIYPIIDDVLAGNNVYLIGEAGGGKTFTAETVAKLLQREYVIINCSQYTSPTEIVGGQTIDGYQNGKLIDAWKNGKILILDEMPRLDPNTAGLFNDALAKSSKTKPASDSKINSTNPKEAPFERNNNFGLIATGNIYPNTPPPPKYKANNQQDLSLLDRFSGSVYETFYDEKTDQRMARFQFLYDMLVGNYYKYMEAVRNKTALPEPKGLRTILKANNLDELAVVSYRTLTSFRVAFEFQLVRELAKSQGTDVGDNKGKTLAMAFRSFLIAFDDNGKDTIINATKMTPGFIDLKVQEAVNMIISGSQGFTDSLTPLVKQEAAPVFDRYKDLLVADFFTPKAV
jgi:cobaltochelatase CobS